jgi:hypothetical protein
MPDRVSENDDFNRSGLNSIRFTPLRGTALANVQPLVERQIAEIILQAGLGEHVVDLTEATSINSPVGKLFWEIRILQPDDQDNIRPRVSMVSELFRVCIQRLYQEYNVPHHVYMQLFVDGEVVGTPIL